MVQNLVHNNLDAQAMGCVQNLFEIVQSTISRIDIIVIRHIVAVIYLRGCINGGKPDAVNTQFLQDRKLGQDPFQVADAVPVGILEAFAVNLIEYRFLPPFSLHIFLPSEYPA